MTHLDLSEVLTIRGRGFTAIRRHADEIDAIATAVEELDAALQQNTDGRSVDDQQALVTAARRLSGLIEPPSGAK